MLFFVAIRYQLTGHLGITSFNGFGLSSHATTYLSSYDLDLFDSSTHDLAKEIYNRKKKLECDQENELITGKQNLFVETMKCPNEYGMIAWLAAIESVNGNTPIPHLSSLVDPWNYPDELKLGSLSTFFTENHSVVVEKKLLLYSNNALKIYWKYYLKWIRSSIEFFLKNLLFPYFEVILFMFFVFGFWPKKFLTIYHKCGEVDLLYFYWFSICSIFYFLSSYLLTTITYVPLERYNHLHGLLWRACLFSSPFMIGFYTRSFVIGTQKK
jgi:hypothetical protein